MQFIHMFQRVLKPLLLQAAVLGPICLIVCHLAPAKVLVECDSGCKYLDSSGAPCVILHMAINAFARVKFVVVLWEVCFEDAPVTLCPVFGQPHATRLGALDSRQRCG